MFWREDLKSQLSPNTRLMMSKAGEEKRGRGCSELGFQDRRQQRIRTDSKG